MRLSLPAVYPDCQHNRHLYLCYTGFSHVQATATCIWVEGNQHGNQAFMRHRHLLQFLRLFAVLSALPGLSACVGGGVDSVGAVAVRDVPVPTGRPAPASAPVETAAEAKLNEGAPLNISGVAGGTSRKPAAPVPAAPAMAGSREGAITEIRAKAASTGNTPPNVFDIPQPYAARMTADDQAKARAELEAAAARNSSLLATDDAKAKAAAAANLKKRAASHYQDALNDIEN
jgi:hypothetical protein